MGKLGRNVGLAPLVADWRPRRLSGGEVSRFMWCRGKETLLHDGGIATGEQRSAGPKGGLCGFCLAGFGIVFAKMVKLRKCKPAAMYLYPFYNDMQCFLYEWSPYATVFFVFKSAISSSLKSSNSLSTSSVCSPSVGGGVLIFGSIDEYFTG